MNARSESGECDVSGSETPMQQPRAKMTGMQPVPDTRRAEYERLLALLEAHASGDGLSRHRARLIARAALEPGHLWRSLGLASRDELRAMMAQSFPELAAANSKDMRWKKFLYKRLCGWGGFHS